MTDGGNCSQPHRRWRRTCLKNWFWRSNQSILIEPRTYPRRNISNLVNSRSHKSDILPTVASNKQHPVAEPREVVHVRVNFVEAFSQMGLLDTQMANTTSLSWYVSRTTLRLSHVAGCSMVPHSPPSQASMWHMCRWPFQLFY
jgi:hypothetical protein